VGVISELKMPSSAPSIAGTDAVSLDHEIPTRRLIYLDWLRFLVVLLLAPFHAAISFTGSNFAYVYDEPFRATILAGHWVFDRGPFLMRYLILFLDNWFMHLLFLISGIAAMAALRKRSLPAFIADRVGRLLLPMVICTLTVIAVQAWLRALWLGRFSGGFISFYPRFFNRVHDSVASRGNFDWGHLWFLGYLFAFCLLLLPLMVHLKKTGAPRPQPSAARWPASGSTMLLPCLWIGALEAIFRPGWPGYQNLVNDWANFTVYLSFFFFGLIAGTYRSLLERAQRMWFMMLATGLLLFISRMAMYPLTHVHPGYSPANMAVQFLRGAAAYCLVIGVLGFAGQYMNRGTQSIAWARNVSFPLYLLHYLPVTAATYLLLNTQFSVWTRWTIAVLASWISVAIFTRLSLLIPAFRWFFGIRIEVSNDYLPRTVEGP